MTIAPSPVPDCCLNCCPYDLKRLYPKHATRCHAAQTHSMPKSAQDSDLVPFSGSSQVFQKHGMLRALAPARCCMTYPPPLRFQRPVCPAR
jgi:hypothetical protein